jgi:hypothetical protein
MMENEKVVIRADVHRIVRERIAAVKDQRIGFGIVNCPPVIARREMRIVVGGDGGAARQREDEARYQKNFYAGR